MFVTHPPCSGSREAIMEVLAPSEHEQKQMVNAGELKVCESSESEGSRFDRTNTSHCVDL